MRCIAREGFVVGDPVLNYSDPPFVAKASNEIGHFFRDGVAELSVVLCDKLLEFTFSGVAQFAKMTFYPEENLEATAVAWGFGPIKYFKNGIDYRIKWLLLGAANESKFGNQGNY